jgi:polyisoprenoid-binding protein YceI
MAQMRIMPFLIAGLLSLRALAQEPKEAAHYWLDATQSTLTWELPATLHTVHGVAPELSGSIELDPGGEEKPIRVHGKVIVRAGSMKTGNEGRDKTMREKVLETDQYPEIVFEIDGVEADWAKLQKAEPFDAKVSGRLTIHGNMLPIEIPVLVAPAGDAVVLSGSFPLHWKAYGLHDPSFGIITVREPMKVLFRLRAAPAGSVSK